MVVLGAFQEFSGACQVVSETYVQTLRVLGGALKSLVGLQWAPEDLRFFSWKSQGISCRDVKCQRLGLRGVLEDFRKVAGVAVSVSQWRSSGSQRSFRRSHGVSAL